jgi:hypothetical protein
MNAGFAVQVLIAEGLHAIMVYANKILEEVAHHLEFSLTLSSQIATNVNPIMNALQDPAGADFVEMLQAPVHPLAQVQPQAQVQGQIT